MQRGKFYKTCARFPAEVNLPSPLRSHRELQTLPKEGSVVMERVSQDSGIWVSRGNQLDLAYGRTCYVAKYDPQTSEAVLFLGSKNGSVANRFLPVAGGALDVTGHPVDEPVTRKFLRTVPAGAFDKSFLLNISHPIKVIAHYMPLSLSHMKHLLFPPGYPVTVGVTGHEWELDTQHRRQFTGVTLTNESLTYFYERHLSYHRQRPLRVGGGSTGIQTVGSSGGHRGAPGASGSRSTGVQTAGSEGHIGAAGASGSGAGATGATSGIASVANEYFGGDTHPFGVDEEGLAYGFDRPLISCDIEEEIDLEDGGKILLHNMLLGMETQGDAYLTDISV